MNATWLRDDVFTTTEPFTIMWLVTYLFIYLRKRYNNIIVYIVPFIIVLYLSIQLQSCQSVLINLLTYLIRVNHRASDKQSSDRSQSTYSALSNMPYLLDSSRKYRGT